MSRIRSGGTDFENEFIAALKTRLKKKFTTHRKDIYGNPDIVFEKQKVCVFLDSNFWHGWQYPRWKHLLKNNFWRQKIARNRQRDRNVTAFLRRHDWKVMRIWEYEVKCRFGYAMDKIHGMVKDKKAHAI